MNEVAPVKFNQSLAIGSLTGEVVNEHVNPVEVWLVALDRGSLAPRCKSRFAILGGRRSRRACLVLGSAGASPSRNRTQNSGDDRKGVAQDLEVRHHVP